MQRENSYEGQQNELDSLLLGNIDVNSVIPNIRQVCLRKKSTENHELKYKITWQTSGQLSTLDEPKNSYK